MLYTFNLYDSGSFAEFHVWSLVRYFCSISFSVCWGVARGPMCMPRYFPIVWDESSCCQLMSLIIVLSI